jgi:hypothetical protein
LVDRTIEPITDLQLFFTRSVTSERPMRQHACCVSGPFAANNVAPSNLDELKRWLEEMVKRLAFTRLVAAIVALVSRLTDINAELAKQLAHLRRARPRSERWKAIEEQLAFTWTMAAAPEGDKSDSSPSRLGKPAR